MSKRTLELFLFDIYIAILKIEYVSSKFENDEELKYDFVSWDSVIREFEIIGEATKVLIQNNIIEQEYRIIVDFRNKITHHYFGIDSQAVWDIVNNNLPKFKQYIKNKIEHIEDELKSKLIQSYLQENEKYDFITNNLGDL
jgi:uncharacterized protein with HEPN domain